jgi:hypothetical protein
VARKDNNSISGEGRKASPWCSIEDALHRLQASADQNQLTGNKGTYDPDKQSIIDERSHK